MTELFCPKCEKRSLTTIRLGEVKVFCAKCKTTYKVIIEIIEETRKNEPGEPKNKRSESP